MKDSSLLNREHIGLLEGEIPGKTIKVYEADFYDHSRIMFPFYDLIASTSAYKPCQDSYTKLWKKIPPLHRVGDKLDNHDHFALIDYAATIIIFFNSTRHRETQVWWHNYLDKYMLECTPKQLTSAQSFTWMTMNGAIATIGYVPEVVYGGLMTKGEKVAFESHRHLVKGCRSITQWVSVKNSPQNKAEPYAHDIYLFNEPMKQYLIVECARLLKKHNKS